MKKNYSGAEALVLQVTRAHICEAFMTWAGMEDIDSEPSCLSLPEKSASHQEKIAFVEENIGRFVDKYCMVHADVEEAWALDEEQRQSLREDGNRLHANQTAAGAPQDLYTPGIMLSINTISRLVIQMSPLIIIFMPLLNCAPRCHE